LSLPAVAGTVPELAEVLVLRDTGRLFTVLELVEQDAARTSATITRARSADRRADRLRPELTA